MKKPILWIAGLGVAFILLLSWVAYEGWDQLEALLNRMRTANASAARHAKPKQNETEIETEEQEEVETIDPPGQVQS